MPVKIINAHTMRAGKPAGNGRFAGRGRSANPHDVGKITPQPVRIV